MDDRLQKVPAQLWFGGPANGKKYTFDRICPITGDAVYQNVKDDYTRSHVLLANPMAHDHQARTLSGS